MLRVHFADCRWFWVWAVVGCAGAVGFVSLGVLVLVPAGFASWLLASRPAIRRSAFGLLTGAGVVLLYVAWLQRAGPGHLNPLPWLLVGAVLFVGGIVAHARRLDAAVG